MANPTASTTVVLLNLDAASAARVATHLAKELPSFEQVEATGPEDALEHIARGAGVVVANRDGVDALAAVAEAAPHVSLVVLGVAADADAGAAATPVFLDWEMMEGRDLEQALEFAAARTRWEREREQWMQERERMSQDLAQIEATLAAAFEHAPIGLAVVAPDGQFVRVNRALAGMLGYSPEELLGVTWHDLVNPSDAPVSMEIAGRLMAGESDETEVELRCLHKDGRTVWVELTGSAVPDEHGPPLHMVGLVRDVTQRRRASGASRFLIDAARLLAVSLDYRKTLGTLTQLAVPRLADWCVGWARERGTVRVAAVAAADPAQEAALVEWQTRDPEPPPRLESAVAQVAETGRPWLWEHLTKRQLDQLASDDRHFQLLQQLDPRSAILVPLTARGRILGVLLLASGSSGYHYGPEDLATVEELAHIAALALHNAHLVQRRGVPRLFPPPEAPEPVEPDVGTQPAGRDRAEADELLDALSRQERRVFELTARGLATAEIAEQLFLSPRTVETYRYRAMRKLGLTTRAELISLALRAHLLVD
jgi:PAS domain S-box-containing protein